MRIVLNFKAAASRCTAFRAALRVASPRGPMAPHPTPAEPDHGAAPAVRAHDLVVARGSTIVLEVDDLDVPRGGMTAFVGPNGSGKSTMFHVIGGLLRPLRGELEILGTPAPHERGC